VQITEQGLLQEDPQADPNHQNLLCPFHLEGRSWIFASSSALCKTWHSWLQLLLLLTNPVEGSTNCTCAF